LLIIDFDLIRAEKELGSNTDEVNEAKYVELPHELCTDLGVPSFIIRYLYLLPSVMYHLDSLVMVGEPGKLLGKSVLNVHSFVLDW